MKTALKVLAAGTIGVLAIIGSYVVLDDRWLPMYPSNTTLIAFLVLPIPIGLFAAWAAYQLIDSL